MEGVTLGCSIGIWKASLCHSNSQGRCELDCFFRFGLIFWYCKLDFSDLPDMTSEYIDVSVINILVVQCFPIKLMVQLG